MEKGATERGSASKEGEGSEGVGARTRGEGREEASKEGEGSEGASKEGDGSEHGGRRERHSAGPAAGAPAALPAPRGRRPALSLDPPPRPATPRRTAEGGGCERARK